MADKRPLTAYDRLGVAKDASAEDIRAAFKKEARKLHPDTDKGDEAKFKQLNEAYDLLGRGRENKESLKRRQEYDLSLSSPFSQTEGGMGLRRTGDPLQDMANAAMSDLFRGTSIFGGLGGFGFGSQQPAKAIEEFKLTDNDLSLLYALREAYKSDKPGTWLVHKSERDKREWMPDLVYSVKRGNEGGVTIFRVITDFRYESDRNNPIGLKKEGSPYSIDAETLDPETRLHEKFFCGKEQNRISGGYNTPYDYENYIRALKDVARKISRPGDQDGKYTLPELETINGFTSKNSTKIRMENEEPYSYNEQREVGRIIPFEKFWDEMAIAGKNVEYIVPRNKEGGRSSGPEGNS